MRWWREQLARVGARTPVARDVVVAGVLAVVGGARYLLTVGPAVDGRASAAPADLLPLVVLAATADTATVALRRRAPRTALALALAVLLATAFLPLRFPWSGIGVAVCAYSVAAHLPRRRAVTVLGAAAVVHAAGGLAVTAAGGDLTLLLTYWEVPGTDVADVVTATLASFGVLGLLGAFVQTQRAYTGELIARAQRLEVEREERARAAVVEERGRIARELHDVAAHDLSALVVQAGAADRLVDRDPDAARAVLRAIRAQGRDTLSELRRLVGIMRDGDTDGRAPRPTLQRLDDLVGAARAAGMSVVVTTGGCVEALPPAVDLAAYRVVQEALSNARRHAPGAHVDVTVTGGEGVRVMVRNTAAPVRVGPAGTGGGHGLLGMRERVEQAGGTLRVGSTPAGGWHVEAHLPAARPRPRPA